VPRLLSVPTVNASAHLSADAVTVMVPGANGRIMERTTTTILAGQDNLTTATMARRHHLR
jgi:hypothetical protein